MKVIFLDLDGVINNSKSNPISEYCIKILKRIVKKTKAKLIITSSIKYPIQASGVSYEKSNLYNNYIKILEQYNLYVYDYTPCIERNRELEINHYLDNHKEIEQYLILDDDYFFEKHNGHQIFIDLDAGLKEEDYNKSISILNGNLIFYDTSTLKSNSKKRIIKHKIEMK